MKMGRGRNGKRPPRGEGLDTFNKVSAVIKSSDKPGAYKELLGLDDEDPIREIEASLSVGERKVYRSSFFYRSADIVDLDKETDLSTDVDKFFTHEHLTDCAIHTLVCMTAMGRKAELPRQTFTLDVEGDDVHIRREKSRYTCPINFASKREREIAMLTDWSEIKKSRGIHGVAQRFMDYVSRYVEDETRRYYECVKADVINDFALMCETRTTAFIENVSQDFEEMFRESESDPVFNLQGFKAYMDKITVPPPKVPKVAPDGAALLSRPDPTPPLGKGPSKPGGSGRHMGDIPDKQLYDCLIMGAQVPILAKFATDQVDVFSEYPLSTLGYTFFSILAGNPKKTHWKDYGVFLVDFFSYMSFKFPKVKVFHEDDDAATALQRAAAESAEMTMEVNTCTTNVVDLEEFGGPFSINIRDLVAFREQFYLPELIELLDTYEGTIQELGFMEEEGAALLSYIACCKDAVNFDDYELGVIKRAYASLHWEHEQLVQKQEQDTAEFKKLTILHGNMQRELADHNSLVKRVASLEYDGAKRTKELERKDEVIESLLAQIEDLRALIPEQDIDEYIDSEPPEVYDATDDLAFPSDIGSRHSIVICGGATPWIKLMNARFPHVKIYGFDDKPNPEALSNADILILNTHACTHKAFYSVREIVRRQGREYIFFSKRGINNCSRELIRIYDAYLESNSAIV